MMVQSKNCSERCIASLLDGVVQIPQQLDVEVSDLQFDSRDVRNGDVFFARRGATTDAAEFAADVLAQGASAMVMEGAQSVALDSDGLLRICVPDVTQAAGIAAHRFFDRPSDAIPVIAITGTNGKTSVADFVAQALRAHRDLPVGVLGTLGAHMALEDDESSVETGLTTPDCITVHRTLSKFRSRGAVAAVMEASSHALDQRRLAEVRVDTAVFTNLSRDHLDYHGDMSRYANAKRQLFCFDALRVAVINAMDPFAGQMRSAIKGDTDVVDYSLDDDASSTNPVVKARTLQATMQGLEIEVCAFDQRAVIRSEMIGRPSAWNLVTAFSVLLHHGIDVAQAADLLGNVVPVAGRMQAFGGGALPMVVVDFAHTPAALMTTLQALRELCPGRLWCVFGAGGDRDQGKRSMMGEISAHLADVVVITDDNPRGEDGDAIAAQIQSGVGASHIGRVRVQRDRASAISDAISQAQPGDLVLVAGKGHEPYQDIGGRQIPFSDLAVARAALSARYSA